MGTYQIIMDRKMNPSIGSKVTFILIIDGRPRPLADGATIIFECDEEQFEIPVFITRNARTNFEGVLTGVADGNDVSILWDIDLNSETLGVIKATNNNTISLQAKPGATRW